MSEVASSVETHTDSSLVVETVAQCIPVFLGQVVDGAGTKLG
ncbi:hypothetical protein MUDAN_BIHEEGNE_03518 [Lactiplantibacillus mudanjiangensis]|nr:hypothetical protein MUDAN_BIHEEGNE_03518 [Lactiplantibacillus mudanjiangensis]